MVKTCQGGVCLTCFLCPEKIYIFLELHQFEQTLTQCHWKRGVRDVLILWGILDDKHSQKSESMKKERL